MVLVGLGILGVPALTVVGRTLAPADIPTVPAPAESALPEPPGTTERMSVVSDGAQGNAGSGGSSDLIAEMNGNQTISADGRWVAFASSATNLVSGSKHPAGGLFLRDRELGTTIAVPWLDGGVFPTGIVAAEPAISADGGVVAFTAIVTGGITGGILVVPATTPYVLAWDRTSPVSEVVSFDDAGRRVPGYQPTISADGRFIGYTRWFVDSTPPTPSNLAANPTHIGGCPPNPPNSSSITATVTDPDDRVTSVTLFFNPEGGSLTSQPMASIGGDVWQSTIVRQSGWATDRTIPYWVQATDSHGNTSPFAFPTTTNQLFLDTCIF